MAKDKVTRNLERGDRFARSMKDCFYNAEHFGSPASMLHENLRTLIFDRPEYKKLPQYMKSFLDGQHQIFRDRIWNELTEYVYDVFYNAENVSQHLTNVTRECLKSLPYYKELSWNPASENHILTGDLVWKNSKKPFITVAEFAQTRKDLLNTERRERRKPEMPYKEGDFGKLADAIINSPREPSFQIPPKSEIMIGEATIGVWEFEDTYAYCEKKSNGYPIHRIIQVDKRIINWTCEGIYCTDANSEVRILSLGRDSNSILCEACFIHEIRYRRMRNRELGKANQYQLPEWSSLEVYTGE